MNIKDDCTKEDERYHLLVEGLGLLDVLTTAGVKFDTTWTNDVMEVERVLGIEAARSLIVREIRYIFDRYGLGIDIRHLNLLSSVMTARGLVLGIQRHGIAKMKSSVLMLASFEKTADVLFDAAAHARVDKINGVSECIILGVPIPLGTGAFKLLNDPTSSASSAASPVGDGDANAGVKIEVKRETSGQHEGEEDLKAQIDAGTAFIFEGGEKNTFDNLRDAR